MHSGLGSKQVNRPTYKAKTPLFIVIIIMLITRSKGQPQREPNLQLKWKCCSLCVWLLSLIINILITRDRCQPQREQHSQWKWKCCFLCVWLASVYCYYYYVNNKKQKKRKEPKGTKACPTKHSENHWKNKQQKKTKDLAKTTRRGLAAICGLA